MHLLMSPLPVSVSGKLSSALLLFDFRIQVQLPVRPFIAMRGCENRHTDNFNSIRWT
jgi:hypothetical protein